MSAASSCSLYLITPPAFGVDAFVKDFQSACDGGVVAALQLRMKDVSDDDVMRAGEVLQPLCAERGITFIVNDSIAIARELGADGVHLGEEDGSIAEARMLLGEGVAIGASCYDSRHLAMSAGEQGADYVAFGAFFPTTTKIAKGQASTELLEWWQETMELPCVAIGGITPDNCGELVRAGADFLAVISAVWNHPESPKAAVTAFNKAISEA